MSTWLKCRVSAGQFPNEYAVSGEQYNGLPYSLFAPSESVVAPEIGEGEGQIRVEILDKKAHLALVRLPAETFENGQLITVSAAELQ
jgi:hypothetical protein